jgi:DNA (cytosine-5)-methyltransferase 1
MKILNLYAGIGGNRKLWGNEHEITAVENNPEIAKIYQEFFPQDKVIIGDANQYLLEHYKEFDFIWSSPPCPSHSRIRFMASKSEENNKYPPIMPDMSLYSSIIFLKHFFKGKWIVENVRPYYEPLIKPTVILDRHCVWSSFPITEKEFNKSNTSHCKVTGKTDRYGINLIGKKLKHRKDQIIRNCVNPELGLHILNELNKTAQEIK